MPDAGGNVTAEKLKLLIERIERLEEEKRGMLGDIREVYAEAKSAGFEPKIMRKVIKLRSMESNKRDEEEMLLDTYKAAVGLA